MHSNITQRLGQRLISYKNTQTSTIKIMNEQLLDLIAHVRTLQDQMIAEQYRQELMREQNQIYQSKIQKLNSRKIVQRERIVRLEEEYEIGRMKKYQLQSCEESLKSIYEEIDSLTTILENRADQCKIIKQGKNRLERENDELKKRNSQFYSRNGYLSNLITNFACKLSKQHLKYQPQKPITALRNVYEALVSEIIALQSKNRQTQIEGSSEITFEKQAIIKLNYELQLLLQRTRDQEKLEKLSQLCASQSNLDKVVQQMRAKEDQLLITLNLLEQSHAKQEKKYYLKLQSLKNMRQGTLWQLDCQIKELQMKKDSIKKELKQIEVKIVTKNIKYEESFKQQQTSMKMDLNLSSLKHLREVEDHSKYLKLKACQLQQTKSLLVKQIQLLYCQI